MILFYLLVLVMPLSEHPLWGGDMGTFTLFKCVGAICGLYAAGYLFSREDWPSFFGASQARWFGLYFLLSSVACFTSGATWSVLSFNAHYVSFLLLLLITVTVVDSVDRLRWVVLMIVASAGLSSLYVLRGWQKYHDMYASYRPGGAVGDSNYFALSTLMCMPLAYYLMLDRKSAWARWFAAVCLLLAVVASTVAASRGGLLGMMVAFLYVIWHSRQRFRNLVLLSVLVVPVMLLSPMSPVRRLINPNQGDQIGADHRTIAWRAGLKMIREHPFAGVGLNRFKHVVTDFENPGEDVRSIAHNTYIEVAAEMGLPGLAVFLAIAYATFRSLGQVLRRRRLRRLLHTTALGLRAGLLGYLVGAFFISAEYQKLFWLIVFLSICLSSLAERAAASRLKAVSASEEQVAAW